ncbi:hypothetical protein [Thermoactinomyces mirandus]|uniref:Uncharacterized protein n=1 Tax=Thermoactinomyces mirandus TaxID=2756294 RepID=A0A7W1XQY5_9BACL|nr:hypothetical protein [Thermoactinomyces mirandus]MBA4601648.1 hypothetical protein [Thermoactinomyces mirandus]
MTGFENSYFSWLELEAKCGRFLRSRFFYFFKIFPEVAGYQQGTTAPSK